MITASEYTSMHYDSQLQQSNSSMINPAYQYPSSVKHDGK